MYRYMDTVDSSGLEIQGSMFGNCMKTGEVAQ